MRLQPRKPIKRKLRRRTQAGIILFISILIPPIVGFLIMLFYTNYHKQQLIRPIPVNMLGNNAISNTLETADIIKKKLAKARIPLKDIQEASDSAFLVTLEDDSLVVMTDKKNIDEQVSSLQVIHDRLTMEGKRFKRLDLRFDRPILVL